MAEVPELPVVEQLVKPLSLVPVGLKEAALDSPTFRATTVHFSDQIEVVERWLGEYLRTAGRLVQEVSPMEVFVNEFLIRSMPPPNLSEAVLDQDYTLLAMQRFSEGAQQFWSHILSCVKKMEVTVLEPIRAFVQGELRNFKDARQYLAQSQKNFDGALARYAAQPKTKEPSALREDAFHLYEARKMYLKASMEFCVLAPQLRSTLDKLLVRVFSDQWREMVSSGEGITNFFLKSGTEVERIRSWSTDMEAGEKIFRRELQMARKTLEEEAIQTCRPSRELDDYSGVMLSALGSKGPSSQNVQPPVKSGSDKAEKQGWLLLRVLTGKPTRTVWVRRWFFVKQGIFGWLVQSIRTGGVEESERVGVLLCSIRVALQEERRFCFEVKTKDNSLLLQAETAAELSEWIEVFERAKKAALDGTGAGWERTVSPLTRDAAFAINPPSAPEFAVRPSENHGLHGSEDITGSYDRTSTLPVPDRDVRSSLDVTNRRSTASERDGEGVRDSASRIIQKLDLHRKSAAGSQLTGASSGTLLSAALTASGGTTTPSGSTNSTLVNVPKTPLVNTNMQSYAPYGRPAELTTANISTVAGQAQSEGDASSTLAPFTLANPPAPTNLTKTAVIVSGERGVNAQHIDGVGSMPNGMMANFWGTISSPLINRLEKGDSEIMGERAKMLASPPGDRTGGSEAFRDDDSGRSLPYQTSHKLLVGGSTARPAESPSPSPARRRRNTVTTDLDVNDNKSRRPIITTDGFPSNYPLQLKTQTAQFRILFPYSGREDKVLLVFRAAWNPNEQQDFPGRAYITERDIHFYSHHLGLVLTSSISLGSVDEVTAALGKDFDLIYIHLKEGSSSKAGYTRITIKVFLENVRLLQRRLNFLVRNYHEQTHRSLESVLDKLLTMENNAAKTPSLESWEDVSIQSPNDEGSFTRQGDALRKQKDLRTTVRIDQDLHRDPGENPQKKEVTKLKLPAGPVVYVPEDMSEAFLERQFDISAKALFHLMFGDKSTIFQMLYHERRAQRVVQTPWRHVEAGHITREFGYQTDVVTMFGRTRPVQIVDHQDIELLNDHLCYLVTDRKTPWHLPHWTDFMLVSKIVITHVAKSKCKLAIYTRVEWSRPPIFSRAIVEKQGLDDLGQDTLRLVDVVTDQVSRLGRQSHTKKAIDIFGHVGQQHEALAVSANLGSREASPGTVAIRPRSLTYLTMETLSSVAESVITSLMMWAFACVRRIWKVSSAHGLLLGLLASSVLTNMFFTSTTTREWWKDRKAGNFMARLGVGPNTIMSRAVNIEAIEDLIGDQIDLRGDPLNQCFATFQSVMSLADQPATADPTKLTISTPLTKATERRLRRTRQQLGTYRHDLLVAMRVVNTIEREMLLAEWENWVGDEMFRCNQVERLIRENDTTTAEGKDVEVVNRQPEREIETLRQWHADYCGSCRRQQVRMKEKGQGQRRVSR
ncbi:MAG: SNF1-interacting protein [Peltula sp. TS41687]|nr:MAG: SNF1-interacting protein [Peltula sp. TS41687]